MIQQQEFDFSKNPLKYPKGSLKKMAIQIVSSTTKRLNKETDQDKKYKLKIIRSEFNKLADEL